MQYFKDLQTNELYAYEDDATTNIKPGLVRISLQEYAALTGADLPSNAVRIQKAAISRLYENALNSVFPYNGNDFYINREDQALILSTTVACLILPEDNQIPTPAPYSGSWFSANLDENKNRIPIKMTCKEFKQFSLAVYAKVSSIIGNQSILNSQIDVAYRAGKTAKEILAIDITKGWE